ncbi:hypothetical protein [Photobacterium damselae]|uniref:Uncharacterized protein n=1 Tax=Photobacterium damselae TaxID=38293 RepID=A0A2T3Q4D4_PHODM|nr:hypothetical protein [Photobacterium damselae]PSW78590.1 hypothetical protein CTN07_20955 [Photobacterium damselae]SPY45070.1 Uncharacterised protein [Photobacterium damselae]
MNKEDIINNWLFDLSGGQWLLLNGQCNLVGEDGMHYATILNYENRMVVMFPLSPAKQPEGGISLSKLLALNSRPDVVGIASFSLAADNATVVLNFALPDESLVNSDLNVFWQNALSLRRALFDAITESTAG